MAPLVIAQDLDAAAPEPEAALGEVREAGSGSVTALSSMSSQEAEEGRGGGSARWGFAEGGGVAPPLQIRQLSDASGADGGAGVRGAGIQELSFLDLNYVIDAPNLAKQRGPSTNRSHFSVFDRSSVAASGGGTGGPSASRRWSVGGGGGGGGISRTASASVGGGGTAAAAAAGDDGLLRRKGKALLGVGRGQRSAHRPKLQILHDVSGEARASEMLALMGPSGSGKTSLLNVLAQRVPAKCVRGGVYIDGKPLGKSFKRQMGFVFQDDLMLWNLTVRETMMFAAKLRLPESIPLSEKEACVDDLIEKLGLSDCAHSIIGKEGRRGVSGGERKRASIGVELVTAPAVLFLDEPTSGLDSGTALSIVTLLRQLARGGMIVVCSIHQPRANIFNQFDKVLLLVKGRTAYYGRTRDMVPYFTSLGLQLPRFTNAADWVLDLTAGTNGSKLLPNGMSITEAYAHSLVGLDDAALKARGIPTASTIKAAETRCQENTHDSRWVTSFLYQLRVLLERQGKQSRGEAFSAVNIFQIMAVAIIASAVWWQSTNVGDITGVFFFISIQQSFNALSSIMRVFPSERGLMIRERSTGSYRVGPYFLAKSFSDMALYVAFPALYATLIYFCAGLRLPVEHFFIYLVVFLSEVMAAQSMGMLISAAIKDFATAQSFSFVLVLVIMLFGGFYVNNNRIPEGIRWIKYLSFLYWGYGALLVNEFRGRTIPCTPDDDASRYGNTCPINGDDVLAVYDFNSIEIWHSVLVLWAMFIGLRIATYFVLRLNTKSHA